VIARSISEEFSSGDTRYRDNDDYPHTREKGKEKEDRDEGKRSILQRDIGTDNDGCCYSSRHLYDVSVKWMKHFSIHLTDIIQLHRTIVQTLRHLICIDF